jgi:hypothetical protein
LYSSLNIIRQIKSSRMRWAGHVAHRGGQSKVYRVLVGKPKGKSPLRRARQRWEDGIKMDLKENGWENEEWIHLALDRDKRLAGANKVMNLQAVAPYS